MKQCQACADWFDQSVRCPMCGTQYPQKVLQLFALPGKEQEMKDILAAGEVVNSSSKIEAAKLRHGVKP